LDILCAQRNLPFRFLPRPYEPVFVDKLLFSEYLCSMGETPVPFSDLAEASDFPCVLKPRRSWKGFRKQARGFVCFSQAEMDELLTTLRAQPPQEDDYFVQKFLVNADNISVSGFYDWQTPQRRFFIATRKVLGDGGTLNTGVIVETIVPPPGIGTRVARILSHLCYHGPFEMEFLRDTLLPTNIMCWSSTRAFGCSMGCFKSAMKMSSFGRTLMGSFSVPCL
jgi:hypothetical protein